MVWADLKDAASRWRRGPARSLGALVAAGCAHLVILLLILGWRPPVPVERARSIEIALVSATALAAAPSAPTRAQASMVSQGELTPQSPPQPPHDAARSNAVEPPAAQKPDAADVSAPAERPPSPTTASAAEILIAGGVDPTAKPLAIADFPAVAAPAALPQPSDTACRILEALQARLQSSSDIRALAALIPRNTLSVSEALLLWDGHWINETSVGGAAVLGPIEQAVAASVDGAPPSCRAAVIHGPRLVLLSGARGSTVFAFGSGDWRWSDTLADLTPPGAGQNRQSR